jgi:hypothetical protein
LQDRPPNGISDLRVDEPQSGAARQAFSKSQAPLVAQGKYYGDAVAIRTMLVDEVGRFYLQHPEVALYDDTSWVATNIQLEAGIDSIVFVAAGKRGEECFDKMVTAGWGSPPAAVPRLAGIGRAPSHHASIETP